MPASTRVMWVHGSDWTRRLASRSASNGALHCVHVFHSSREAMAARHRWNVEVCLVEARLPDGLGIEFIHQAARTLDAPRFILLGDHMDGRTVLDAVVSGADGLLLRPLKVEDVHAAVRSVAHGDVTIPTHLLNTWVRHMRGGRKPGIDRLLSDREQRVLQLLAEGLTYKSIGERLFISPFTVKNHVHRILGKLGVRTRIEAVQRSIFNTQK